MPNADDHRNLQRAISLHQNGSLNEAPGLYRELIKKNANNFHALHFLGLIEAGAGNMEQAKDLMARSLSVQPPNIQFIENYAAISFQTGDYETALTASQEGLRLNNANARLLYVSAVSLFKLSRFEESATQFDRLLSLEPNHIAALNERGSVLAEMQRYDAALASVEKALMLAPEYAEAHVHKGNLFAKLKRFNEALAAYDRAIALKPYLAEAWLGRGNAYFTLKRFDQAVAAYEKALATKGHFNGAEGFRFAAKMQLCDWTNYDAERSGLSSSIRQGNLSVAPFEFLAISSSPQDQLQCAKLWIANKHPAFRNWEGHRYNHDRIRIAYLSADFREHPVSFAIAGMLERHDKSRFDVTAISLGPDDNSEMRRRLKASFERFVDAEKHSDDQISGLIKELEIDILVDLAGFTEGSRPNIFAQRAAPIQVNYLGYPGTMGADYFDYIIADRTVIPEDQRKFYSEKIVYLPNSFQPADRERRISDKQFTRTDAGLPLEGFVYCCFNTSYKITPDIYDTWMHILSKVNGSLLWLVAASSAVERNLRNEAAARGIDANRLIFAPPVSLPEHQARLPLADLFLDTWSYNAGATASDTLWAGVPILTRIGRTIVGRMAASLLNAARLPELITTTAEAYEQIAIDLATDPEKMSAIKRKLAENRLTTPLFDTELSTKHIEAAYSAMHELYQAGLAPEHIVVPN